MFRNLSQLPGVASRVSAGLAGQHSLLCGSSVAISNRIDVIIHLHQLFKTYIYLSLSRFKHASGYIYPSLMLGLTLLCHRLLTSFTQPQTNQETENHVKPRSRQFPRKGAAWATKANYWILMQDPGRDVLALRPQSRLLRRAQDLRPGHHQLGDR